MNEALLKAFKWYFIALFVIIGASAFIISDKTDTIKPVIIGVFAFGVVYVSSLFWQDVSNRIFVISAGVFLAISQLSSYIPMIMYVFLDFDINWFDPYYTWAAATAIIGIPIMVVVFKFFDS
ncbi:MAG: hypothetical protein ACRBDI_09465 [Alphaproteobacteria bacterium]